MHEDKLPLSVARVKGALIGTGFFIGRDGSLLTCRHLLYDKRKEECQKEDIEIRFKEQSYLANLVSSPTPPGNVDMAVLRLEGDMLPEGAVILPLARWQWKPGIDHRVRSFGFRKAEGLYAAGEIRGSVSSSSGPRLLQLAPEASGAEEHRRGMSGAPVYDDSLGAIVGMVALREKAAGKLHLPGQLPEDAVDYPAETIPFAIPMEEIGLAWGPIEERLQETDLFQGLLRVLKIGKWFTKDHFRSFYKSLPFTLRVYEELRGDRPKALLEQIREQDQLHDLFRLLQQSYPTIPLIDIKPSANRLVRFVNREQELNNACDRDVPPLVLLDAPAGYGKTALLSSILDRHYRDNWVCVRVDVPEDCDRALGLCLEVARGAGVAGDLADLRSGREVGLVLGSLYGQQARPSAPRIALFVDCVERLAEEAIAEFLDGFLGYLQGKHTLRAFFAGRYVSSKWERQAGDLGLGLMILQLTPFRFRYVRETVEHLAPDRADLDLLAAYLMHVTGGHPGCMAEIMKRMDPSEAAETYLVQEQDHLRRIVLDLADGIRESIAPDLRNVLESLSVFRRYTYHMLTRILETDLVEYDGNAASLEDSLAATYLVDRNQGFIQDEIVRRLLSNRLRWKDRVRFLKLCKLARDLYLEALPSKSNPHVILLEMLYQELRIGYHEGGQTPAERQALRERFLAQGGILGRCLVMLSTREEDYQDAKRDLLTLLDDENENWEFRFTINFYLRQDSYSNEPFEAMCQEVKDFFDSQEGDSDG